MATIIDTIKLTNEFCSVLTDIERTGMKVRLDRLDRMEDEFRNKFNKLKAYLDGSVSYFMGDTPINLGSPEQLSKVIFSRSINSKTRWANEFGLVPNMKSAHKMYKLSSVTKQSFVGLVRKNTTVMYKTQAIQCPTCKGKGRLSLKNKDGSEGKRPRICNSNLKKLLPFRFATICDGLGYTLKSTPNVAGLGCIPRATDVSASGFSTDKEVIERCLKTAKGKAKLFLEALLEYNMIDSKLNNLIPGIRKGLVGDMLHPTFNQAVTATGRLSSKNPNVQNFPRGTTFPIKQIFTSRWEGGKLLEVDYSGLEFVAAVELSGDEEGTRQTLEKEDKHGYTARYLRNRGQETSRQEAKSVTFLPLYGGSSGTDAEVEYCKHFYELHPGIAKWHGRLTEEVIANKRITLPSGRFYSFPNAVRTARGCTSSTQVKNYPVQGFATADIVPCSVVAVYRVLQGYNSKIINTVHDSIIVDIHPDEVDIVPKLVYTTMIEVDKELLRRYGYKAKLPFRAEASIGPNWFNLSEIDNLK